jgi:hypothetical protein
MTEVQEAELDAATLDWLTDRVLDAVAREERAAAAELRFLLHRLSTTGRDDIAAPLGAALGRELDRQAQRGCDDDCEGWIAMFSEAAAASDDPRLPRAAADLLQPLRARWSSAAPNTVPVTAVDEIMRAVEACLLSINVPEARALVAEAIDALERVVAGAYRPGLGVAHEIATPAFVRGGLSDHVRSASSLLTAYMLTARLPYAMLADELMQLVLRTPPAEPDGHDVAFALNCELARVLCRLAALHHDEEYRRTAVLPIDEDYAADAARTLTGLASSVRERGADLALFGLALAEWLEVR